MKFICTKENLSYSLDLVSGVAGRHASLPILMNILIQAEAAGVRLVATNLEMAIKTSLRAKVDEAGSFTVPAKTLTDFVHLLPDEQVEVSLQENEVFIKCGNSSTKIKGTPADEYPVVPEIEEKHAYTVNAEMFKDSLSRVVLACAKNEIRPELSGVYFGLFTERYPGLLVAATDSYRLAEKKLEVEQGTEEARAIVPSRTVYELARLVSLAKNKQGETKIRLWLSEGQIAARYDDFEVSSRLVEGKYPDYAQIIPTKTKTTASFPVGLMVNKIKTASLFTASGVNAVSFDLNASQGTIGLSSTSTQTGEHSSEIESEVLGEENSILLNHRYVLDGLQNLNSEDGEFGVNSSDTPCVFRAKNKDDYVYVVMPIRQ
ncbi:MAG: DNA polymerase III subunit beta [Candidatus Magasanikbacteria bacterium RIFCSPLOWO2_01_FULL_43_20b]|uniref:Beta sliding clamp n=1 Tax=Candidatus Magasanikbacteria bacterium RIFCSPLOWO2_12_FULL_43_12 TaxID=1798692 RepID=A0A1F6MVG8_9BACT|nr:MAG: DNA polymerase III subunit beta [Candidatus Magasanikbacteria bacterium RIFCSPLOWO2_02_FULL_43_22]OGH72137.1 MAG: DNA polymerase III subunit beta [Candidatus Magasanikbacteria bacterium RIFCSPHIGHO2_02_FULL_44_13]OGH73235.1 MAG: DNA polymerase III subunit beta [Candidatus Magasanikbacteria bacterium RIFCSPLOWO2_01_FULL_43_20b]OGH75644.1 MAG: DNA polymerase III subunit beta [Candidatus Magasanikbacteria bacterium RIFCSPLOWO2_12_FULL_43_12]